MARMGVATSSLLEPALRHRHGRPNESIVMHSVDARTGRGMTWRRLTLLRVARKLFTGFWCFDSCCWNITTEASALY